jgi:hypothetical protein
VKARTCRNGNMPRLMMSVGTIVSGGGAGPSGRGGETGQAC